MDKEMQTEENGFDKINKEFLDEESAEFLKDYENELEIQRERIAEEKEIEDEETLDKLLTKLNYLENEYIVEGARLTCSRCTKEPRTVKYKGKIIDCNYEDKKVRDRIFIFEDRAEEINGLIPVNIEDCKGGLLDDNEKDESVNVVSLGNCTYFPEGKDIEEIIAESGCTNRVEEIIEALGKGLGTCYCFMRLNKEWENMPLGKADGLTGQIRLPSAGIDSFLSTPSYMKFNGKEGINMMSMLFCNLGGGCITALESGQNSYFNDVRYQQLLRETERRNGRIEDYKIEFVLEIFPIILEDEKKSGVPAEVTFAQMCTESGYGQKTCIDINTGIDGKNYFGIKGEGPAGSVTIKTTEEVGGNRVSVTDDFRAYNSMEESIEDHSNLLISKYQQYVTTGTVEDWCEALKKGGYATASNYKEEILRVCKTWKII